MRVEEQTDVLERELLRIWRKLLNSDILTIDDDFFEAGGDSLLAIRMLIEVGELTGRQIEPSTLFETGTIRRLLKRMKSADRTHTEVSVLIGPAKGRMIHYFNGDLEHKGVGARTFSDMLGDNYLIHSISPISLNEENLPESVEEMAKERLQKIIERQPGGQYILMGQCNGALVAFEAARQLVSIGLGVKAVVMVDPVIMSVRRSARLILATADFFMRLSGVSKIRRHEKLILMSNELINIDSMTKDPWCHAVSFCRKKWAEKIAAMKDLQKYFMSYFDEPMPDNRPEERKRLNRYYDRIFFHYRPLPINLPVLYISLQYSGRAWRKISRNIQYINIFRGHHTSWKEDYSPYLAERIREFINR